MNVLMFQGKKSLSEGSSTRPWIYRAAHRPARRERVQAGAQQRQADAGSKEPAVGGATYQVPVEVRPERRTALAMR